MAEAERYLKTTRKTITKLVREGRIAGAKVGRSYRFLKSELARFLARGGRSPRAAERDVAEARAFLARLGRGLYESASRAADHDSIYGE